MDSHIATLVVVVVALATGFHSLAASSAPSDETARKPSRQIDQTGRNSATDKPEPDDDVKRGMGTAAGAVTGAFIGSQIGNGSRRSIVTGAAIGAAIGSSSQNRTARQREHGATVGTAAGSDAIQTTDDELPIGTNVRVESRGEAAGLE